MMDWSQQQLDIFSHIEGSDRSLVVEAVAGSGKTATLVEAAHRLSPMSSAIFVAFNKRVADTLASKLPASVPALTLNALGNRAWRAYNDRYVPVEGFKIASLVRSMTENLNKEFCAGVRKLVDVGKCVGVVPGAVQVEFAELGQAVHALVPDTAESWDDIVEEYDINFGPGGKQKEAVSLARKVLAQSIRMGGEKIDFNDQLYLPVIFGVEFPKFDIVFVDEAQDCSGINLEIIQRSVRKGGRVVAVGDGFQAIYHWRGAGSDSLPEFVRRFDAERLPLTTCYRCPKAVVAAAQKYVPHIQPAPWAEDGKVEGLAKWTHENFAAQDVVLCRFNAPLVKMAFGFIRKKKACKVLGRNIGAGLTSLVDKLRAKSMLDLEKKLEEYFAEEQDRLIQAHKESSIAALVDKVECLRVFMEEAQTVEALKANIEGLFADETNGWLTLSTVHKAKGLEWDRVFWLNPEKVCRWDLGAGEQHLQGVRNLKYVCTTRARKELYYITDLEVQ